MNISCLKSANFTIFTHHGSTYIVVEHIVVAVLKVLVVGVWGVVIKVRVAVTIVVGVLVVTVVAKLFERNGGNIEDIIDTDDRTKNQDEDQTRT